MHSTCIPGTPDHVSDLIGINGAIKQCQNVVEVLSWRLYACYLYSRHTRSCE